MKLISFFSIHFAQAPPACPIRFIHRRLIAEFPTYGNQANVGPIISVRGQTIPGHGKNYRRYQTLSKYNKIRSTIKAIVRLICLAVSPAVMKILDCSRNLYQNGDSFLNIPVVRRRDTAGMQQARSSQNCIRYTMYSLAMKANVLQGINTSLLAAKGQ